LCPARYEFSQTRRKNMCWVGNLLNKGWQSRTQFCRVGLSVLAYRRISEQVSTKACLKGEMIFTQN
jgi:hypothetical protein